MYPTQKPPANRKLFPLISFFHQQSHPVFDAGHFFHTQSNSFCSFGYSLLIIFNDTAGEEQAALLQLTGNIRQQQDDDVRQDIGYDYVGFAFRTVKQVALFYFDAVCQSGFCNIALILFAPNFAAVMAKMPLPVPTSNTVVSR